ncbi:unnamed protein product, partial [Mesorhabditis spiculigera]
MSKCPHDDAVWPKYIYLLETILGLVSLPLYILVLCLITRSKTKQKYSTPFYRIFTWHACFNILSFIHHHIFLEFPTLNIFCAQLLSRFHSFSYRLTPIYFLAYFLQHSQICLSTLVSVNRMSVITLGAKYQQFWAKALPYSLVMCFLVPLLLTWPLLVSEVALLPTNSGLGMAYNKWITWPSNSLSSAALSLLCAILNGVSTGVLVLRIRSNRGCAQANLLGVGIALGTISILFSIDQVMIYYHLHIARNLSHAAFGRFHDARFLVNTLATLAPIWALLILSSEMRADIVKMVSRTSEPLIE